MKKFPQIVQTLLRVFTPIIFMLVLILSVIRLVMTPLAVRAEYHTPNFPIDPYGFSLDDRLEYGVRGLDYIFNDEGISYLGDLTFEDGSPMFNERELSHMLDVKILVGYGMQVYVLILGIYSALLLWAVLGGWWEDFKHFLGLGGRLTVFALIFLLVGIAISFDWVFTKFHHLFFSDDSWLFYTTDTLIRLYPIRFWQDLFTAMGVIALALGALCWVIFLPRKGAQKEAPQKGKKGSKTK